MLAGNPNRLGAHPDREGVQFSLYSSSAQAVELCLFDPDNRETARHFLPDCTDGVWHGYLPGCTAGQRYGYRVHGRYAPDQGDRFNHHKLLLDPYARLLSGEFRWSPAVFGFTGNDPDQVEAFSTLDSAPFVPKGIVTNPPKNIKRSRSSVDWFDMILYELHVRGFTMRHPDLSEAERGKLSGLAHPKILDYLKALGVTSIELMPVHAFIDESFLEKKGLRNYWGYNSIGFFAPAARYYEQDGDDAFRAMTDAFHDAGFEVILDVVYNHTGESGADGPTLSWRGIDNLAYYRTEAENPAAYINDTGCGNTVNVDHPATQRLILDSLRYWAEGMGVDGFRFDLAPVLGRRATGFDRDHPLWEAIVADAVVGNTKLIAEPWDPGPGGYQLGHMPVAVSEWNDQYRDSIRRFWRGDHGQAAEFAQRLHGSSDIFEHHGRSPRASINFITGHDGFTLTDVVSYVDRHNQANGEKNRDGHQHNFSANYGVEGQTDDPLIVKARRKQKLNMLATLLFSQGVPMLLAGDEFGQTQNGNNNAYAQDNETTWLDWAGIDRDPDFLEHVKALIAERRRVRLFRQRDYLHQNHTTPDGRPDIEWLGFDAQPLTSGDWEHTQVFLLILHDLEQPETGDSPNLAALAFNASDQELTLSLPAIEVAGRWELRFASSPNTRSIDVDRYVVGPSSLLCLLHYDGELPG